MATPKVVTDGSSDLDEAVLNKFVSCPKAEVKINYFSVTFTAADNSVAVDAGIDSCGEIVTGDCAWDAGDMRIEIVLTGFSNVPVAFASLRENLSTNVEKVWASALASSVLAIDFKSIATPGTSVDPDGNVTVGVLVIGY